MVHVHDILIHTPTQQQQQIYNQKHTFVKQNRLAMATIRAAAKHHVQ